MLKIKISRGLLIYQIWFKIKPSKNLEIWWHYYYVFYFFIIKFLRGYQLISENPEIWYYYYVFYY